MAKDLRSYLGDLRQRRPGDWTVVNREVDPDLELTAVLRKLQQDNRFPVVLFRRVKGTAMPVLANTLASRERLALALDTATTELTREYVRRVTRRVPVTRRENAPVQEVVKAGADADLYELPHIVHCGNDGGPYISSGLCIVKDPDTGIHNMGIYRLQIKGRNKLGIYPGHHSHAAHILLKKETKGEPLEIAIAIGHHPAVYMAAQYRGSLDDDEFEVAGALLGEPLEVTTARTVDLLVPAAAEIVIEGRVLPGVREEEGPFGEYTWYLGDKVLNPVIEVTAVTRRRDPYFFDIFSAHPEHNLCGLVGHEALLYRKLKESIPTVTNVCVPFSGTCRHSVYVSIKKEYDGLGRNAALTALAAHPFIKLAIIVDDDIDVFNEAEVMWAVVTRVQADRDVFVIPDSYVCELDPSAYDIKDRTARGGLNAKWAIDATKPVGIRFLPRADVPESRWKDIDLSQYIDGGNDS